MGEILDLNMNKLEAKMKETGCAPTDLLNRFKKVNREGTDPATSEVATAEDEGGEESSQDLQPTVDEREATDHATTETDDGPGTAAPGTSASAETGKRDQVPRAKLPPPAEFYHEETAYKYHNPPLPVKGKDIPGAVAPEDLLPLPLAPPIPELPNTGKCTWTWDEESRVLLADFRQKNGNVEVVEEDERFRLAMMERDDVTVISDGLANCLTGQLWNLEHIASAVGDEYYHKFRRFDREQVISKRRKGNGSRKHKDKRQQSGAVQPSEANVNDPAKQPHSHRLSYDTKEDDRSSDVESDDEDKTEDWISVVHREKDSCLSMQVLDFVRYLEMRRDVLERKRKSESASTDLEPDNPDFLDEGASMFSFVDHLGKDHEINVTQVVLYMIDFDLVKLLPMLYEDLQKNLKCGGCLPGGTHCMMNAVSARCWVGSGRPNNINSLMIVLN